MTTLDAGRAGTFAVGGDITVNRLGFGAMRITGLGIWGEPDITGKPVWSDLRQAKKTIPVAAAIANAGMRADELRALLAASATSEADARRAAELIERCDGRRFTEETANRHLDAALAALDRAEPRPDSAGELRELAQFVVARDR